MVEGEGSIWIFGGLGIDPGAKEQATHLNDLYALYLAGGKSAQHFFPVNI